MDLLTIVVDDAPGLKEIDYHLPDAAAQSGLSQYELLTTSGSRFERVWR